MLQSINLADVLFIDIETVPANPSFNKLDDRMKGLWEKKSSTFRSETQNAEEVYQRAGIYAEFGKIICISAGFMSSSAPPSLRIKTTYGDNEKDLLMDFTTLLEKFSRHREMLLCAHNGKEFDFPYIARRMVINSLTIPQVLNNAGKKPWEVHLLDTMELWKFGDFKSYTSLDLLTAVLGIKTPKDDIDGSMVADVYWKESDLKRIVKYCEKDVLAIAQIMRRFLNLPLISEENVESVTTI